MWWDGIFKSQNTLGMPIGIGFGSNETCVMDAEQPDGPSKRIRALGKVVFEVKAGCLGLEKRRFSEAGFRWEVSKDYIGYVGRDTFKSN